MTAESIIDVSITLDLWIKNLPELERLAAIADEENGLYEQAYTPDQAFAIAVNNAALSAQAFKCLEGWSASPETPFEKQTFPDPRIQRKENKHDEHSRRSHLESRHDSLG